MLNRRRAAVGLAVGLGGLAVVPLAVTRIEIHQALETYRLLPRDRTVSPSAQKTAVIYFSRSGNTALLSRHLAIKLDAALYPITASDYDLGLMGWANAMIDARKIDAVISPPSIDLTGHDVVYLGSPIWLYSPAPPIWQFVEQNRFDGKRVVLFNTFNSKFKPEFIEIFRQKVLQRGARVFEHQFIKRGRMGWQLSSEAMLQAFTEHWISSSS